MMRNRMTTTSNLRMRLKFDKLGNYRFGFGNFWLNWIMIIFSIDHVVQSYSIKLESISTIIEHNSNQNRNIINRYKRFSDASIPFVATTGLIYPPEIRTIAAAVCKSQCLIKCSEKLIHTAEKDMTVRDIVKSLNSYPTQLKEKCNRLSPGFLYYDECEQACDSDRLYNDCIKMCETGDSPGGWSCLTGCRALDAALKHRSGDCPLQGGPAIHRLPEFEPSKLNSPTPVDDVAQSLGPQSDQSGNWLNMVTQTEQHSCTFDAECPNKSDKCCQSKCMPAVFRHDLVPPIPIVRIIEEKNPPSFVLSWNKDLSTMHNFTNPTVYVLQVKAYFGPEYDYRLSSPWKTLVMSTLTGAQLSEPAVGWWYQFQVASVNQWGSLGFDVPSPPVQLTSIQPTSPSPPQDLTDGVLTLQANGKIRVNVHWTSPVSASIPVTEYRISWGPDSMYAVGDQEFSEKPTQFVHTLPASQTTYQLTNLMPDLLYRVQVIAMSEWGSTQLRSQPNTLFIFTPALSHLQDRQSMEHQQFGHLESLIDPISTTPPKMNSNQQSVPDQADQRKSNLDSNDSFQNFICDGTSKSMIIQNPILNSPADVDSHFLTTFNIESEPAIYDGHELSVQLILSELYSGKQYLSRSAKLLHNPLEPRRVLIRWKPQVCIETRIPTASGIPSLRPDQNSNERKKSSDHHRFGQMNTGSNIFIPNKQIITLNPPYPGVLKLHNLTGKHILRQSMIHLFNLNFNCRYLVDILTEKQATDSTSTTSIGSSSSSSSSSSSLDSKDDQFMSTVQLSAWLCTPSCSSVKLAPWINKLDCDDTTKERFVLPEPVDLTYERVPSKPFTYNISWSDGTQTILADLALTRTKISQEDLAKFLHYRIIWGPSRDGPFRPALWKSWPNLRPRLDHSQAETKVLRNKQTSITLENLQPNTQYVVKLQAIASSTIFADLTSSQTNAHFAQTSLDRSKLVSTTESTYPDNSESLMTSKEVYLHFETPTNSDEMDPVNPKWKQSRMFVEQKNGSGTSKISHFVLCLNLLLILLVRINTT